MSRNSNINDGKQTITASTIDSNEKKNVTDETFPITMTDDGNDNDVELGQNHYHTRQQQEDEDQQLEEQEASNNNNNKEEEKEEGEERS
jgi:hypothetical protein